MKNFKAMYALAKAKAIDKGPRRFRKLAGFALTEEELKKIYTLEGFVPKRSVWSSHAEIWEELGWARWYAVGENGSRVLYFVLEKEDPSNPPLLSKIGMAFPDMTETDISGVVVA